MKNGNIIFICSILLISSILLNSCLKNEPNNNVYVNSGVFVVCEGNFTRNNSGLTFYSPDSKTVINDIFFVSNGIDLGDVAQSGTIIGNKLYIVVNNSGIIRVVDKSDVKLLQTFPGFTSPRYILNINENQSIVSDLATRFLWVINHHTGLITDSVWIGKSTETMLKCGNKLYAANWTKLGMPDIANNTITVVDLEKMSVLDTITCGIEPNSMVTDKNGYLWVLCSGGFSGNQKPSLRVYNPEQNTEFKVLVFPNRQYLPSHLCINNSLDTLYYINGNIWRMPVNSVNLPDNFFINANGRNFYSLAVSPSGDIYVADAVDFNQQGIVYRYNTTGEPVDSFRTGIIPGYFIFKDN